MFARHSVRPGFSIDHERTLRYFVDGTDVFSRESDGKFIADQYRRSGIVLNPPPVTNRVNGWAEIMACLGDPAVGQNPTLFIHERRARLIDAVPILQRDPLRPEDVLKVDADEEGKGGNDAADALRYLLARKASTPGVVFA